MQTDPSSSAPQYLSKHKSRNQETHISHLQSISSAFGGAVQQFYLPRCRTLSSAAVDDPFPPPPPVRQNVGLAAICHVIHITKWRRLVGAVDPSWAHDILSSRQCLAFQSKTPSTMVQFWQTYGHYSQIHCLPFFEKIIRGFQSKTEFSQVRLNSSREGSPIKRFEKFLPRQQTGVLFCCARNMRKQMKHKRPYLLSQHRGLPIFYGILAG